MVTSQVRVLGIQPQLSISIYSIFGTSNIIRVKKKKLHKYNIKKEKEIRNPH